MKLHIKRHAPMSAQAIIALGFFLIILIMTLLLMLPISSNTGEPTDWLTALFTATSAVCVTGLVAVDTATHWSLFGRIVIITGIQIGGLGVTTLLALISLALGKRIGLRQRTVLQESVASLRIGGIVRLVKRAIIGTLIIEGAGALLLSFRFVPMLGLWRGLGYSVFHSISAFCNAGFDLLGVRAPFSSLTSYAANPVINLTIMFLIVFGGIGFLTWDDIRLHLRKYRMQSKVILCTTAVLLIAPAMYFYFFEFADLTRKERLLSSLFQAVTPRTAGFNTVELTDLSEAGQFITIALMLIGGSPGSTAGGLKTTTIAVLFTTAISTFRRRENAHLFGRRIDDDVVKNAATISLMYITLCCTGGLIISVSEGLPMLPCLFETASAVGTVGLSLGITPELNLLSRSVLILLMFFGRVGGLTLIFAALSSAQKKVSKLPKEKITVG